MRRLSKPARLSRMLLAAVVAASILLDACSNEDHPIPGDPLQLKVVTAAPGGFQVNSTLVTGQKDAILIDAQFTISDAANLVKVIQDSKKNLTTVYITHAHADHYFGLVEVKKAFPNAKIVALPSTVADIKSIWQDQVNQWKPILGDAITANPIIPDVLSGTTLQLEGENLEILGEVQGDKAGNSYVWIPSLKAVVCGDIVYNGVFPWTIETNPVQRTGWIATIEKVKQLNPSVVVAGHKNPTWPDDASSLDLTKAYLTHYDAVLPTAQSSEDFQNKVKEKYSNLQLEIILKLAADALFP